MLLLSSSPFIGVTVRPPFPQSSDGFSPHPQTPFAAIRRNLTINSVISFTGKPLIYHYSSTTVPSGFNFALHSLSNFSIFPYKENPSFGLTLMKPTHPEPPWTMISSTIVEDTIPILGATVNSAAPDHPEDDGREEPFAFLAVKLLTTRHFNSEAFKNRLKQMWPELSGIPFLKRSRALAQRLGEVLGRFIEVDTASLNETWGPYLRVRIEMDVTQPLPRGTGFHFHANPASLAPSSPYRFHQAPVITEGPYNEPTSAYGIQHLSQPQTTLMGLHANLSSPHFNLNHSPPTTTFWPAHQTVTAAATMASRAQSPAVSPNITAPSHLPTFPPITTAEQLATPLPRPISTTAEALVATTGASQHVVPVSQAFSTILSDLNPAQPPRFAVGSSTNPTPSSTRVRKFKPQRPDCLNAAEFRRMLKRTCNLAKSLEDETVEEAGDAGAMNIISWNARGLGSKRAFRSLSLLVKQNRPTLLYIMESKLPVGALNKFASSLKFPNGLEVPRVGLSGGLLLLWTHDVDVTLLSYNISHFHCYLKFPNFNAFTFTAFYGAPHARNKLHSWHLIDRLGSNSRLQPWLIMGDFNDYLSLSDKIGGNMSRTPSTQFQSFIDNYELHPLTPLGNLFSWTNRQKPPHHTQERIDWCLSNEAWDAIFPASHLNHGDFFGSDHRPLILNLSHMSDPHTPPPRFIFDKLWMSEPGFEDCLREAWTQTTSNTHSNPLTDLNERLANCSSRLNHWKKSLGPPLTAQIRIVQSQLQLINSLPNPTTEQLEQSQKLEEELSGLLQKEEVYWQQRSRVTWLKLGDKNTRYFHRMASQRRTTNKILSLQRLDGSWANDTPSILATIEQYFTTLFQSQMPDNEVIEYVLSGISESLTPAEIDLLQATFTASEVKTTTFQLAHDKAPGLDGYSGSFFQKNWHLLGQDVTIAALNFLNGDADLAAINQMLLVLIPKRNNPLARSELSTHRLCSTFYKIISGSYANLSHALGIKIARRANHLHLFFGDDSLLLALLVKSCDHHQELLRSGLRKSIGDGTTINIYNDAWIPGYGKLSFLRYHSNADMTVADLITPTKQWNHDTIQSLFPTDITQAIISIPLYTISTPDTYYWTLTPHGSYTVNSGYHLAHRQLHHTEPSPSNNKSSHDWWKALWNLSLPPKYHDETLEHALFRCSAAQKLWNCRNIWLHEGLSPSPNQIIRDASIYFEQYKNCTTQEPTPSPAQEDHSILLDSRTSPPTFHHRLLRVLLGIPAPQNGLRHDHPL
uniref:Endonuclease/exonuclease/phosphatase domain-containing protein n=1 Tax=Cannabis sativa TaxID=3483 RepID=A0A803P3A5_CANSA